MLWPCCLHTVHLYCRFSTNDLYLFWEKPSTFGGARAASGAWCGGGKDRGGRRRGTWLGPPAAAAQERKKKQNGERNDVLLLLPFLSSLAIFVSQILLFANSQNNMGRKKRSNLQQFGKLRFPKPKIVDPHCVYVVETLSTSTYETRSRARNLLRPIQHHLPATSSS